MFDFVFPDCQLNDDEQEDSLRADTSRLPAHSLLLPKGVQPRAAPPDIPALVQREDHLQDQGGVSKLCQRQGSRPNLCQVKVHKAPLSHQKSTLESILFVAQAWSV